MEAKDVMSLPWKPVTDWSDLSASSTNKKGRYCIGQADVDIFVENIYRDICRKLNISYDELVPILVSENRPFYSLKDRLFLGFVIFDRKHPSLIKLQNTLRVPDISNLKDTVSSNKVCMCLNLFEELSNIEKLTFLQKIGKINVKIEHFAVSVEETTVE